MHLPDQFSLYVIQLFGGSFILAATAMVITVTIGWLNSCINNIRLFSLVYMALVPLVPTVVIGVWLLTIPAITSFLFAQWLGQYNLGSCAVLGRLFLLTGVTWFMFCAGAQFLLGMFKKKAVSS